MWAKLVTGLAVWFLLTAPSMAAQVSHQSEIIRTGPGTKSLVRREAPPMAAQANIPFDFTRSGSPVRRDIPASFLQMEQDQREAWTNFMLYYNHALRFFEGDSQARAAPAPVVDGSVTDPYTQEVFEHFYKKNTWANSESRSGSGSTVKSTAKYRECIGSWIQKYNVSVFLDIPCGDGNWQKFIPGIDKVSYYGYDISPSAVDAAKTKNKDMANMQYGVLDLASSDPPLKADMIMVKEVIQHLPLQMGLKMLQHAKHAGIKWLVVTHNSKYTNKDVGVGWWFPGPNALAPPFNFASAAEECSGDLALFDLKAWPGNR